jgi:formylglycine-generating enzyme
MLHIPGGHCTMGDDDERPEERVAHPVTVGPFWIDRHEVTNAQFRRFVAATGYVTIAERGLDPKDHPGVPADLLAAGAMVFTPPTSLRNLIDITQ